MLFTSNQNQQDFSGIDKVVLKAVWHYRYGEGVLDHTLADITDLMLDEVNQSLSRLERRGLVSRFGIYTGGFAWKFSGRNDESFERLMDRYHGRLNEVR